LLFRGDKEKVSESFETEIRTKTGRGKEEIEQG
jgi:hypothetical protein